MGDVTDITSLLQGLREAARLTKRRTVSVEIPVPDPGRVMVARLRVGADGRPFVDLVEEDDLGPGRFR